MESIAIFGGTFNPIHNGHVNLAIKIKNHFSIDRLILMPTKIPPHKRIEELADDDDRLEMCRLATIDLKGVEVSNYEITRGDVSYTVNTLRYFKKEYPTAQLFFIMGSDMFLSLESWYCFEEILSMATIITASRQNGDFEKIKDYAICLKKYNANVALLPVEPYEISSSQIRNDVKTGKDFTCYLPERVVQYIRNKKLYNYKG